MILQYDVHYNQSMRIGYTANYIDLFFEIWTFFFSTFILDGICPPKKANVAIVTSYILWSPHYDLPYAISLRLAQSIHSWSQVTMFI